MYSQCTVNIALVLRKQEGCLNQYPLIKKLREMHIALFLQLYNKNGVLLSSEITGIQKMCIFKL